MGEGRVERVDVFEIREMRQMIAKDVGVEGLFERLPSQRAGLRTLAHRLENVDFQARTPLGRDIVRRDPGSDVLHAQHFDRGRGGPRSQSSASR